MMQSFPKLKSQIQFEVPISVSFYLKYKSNDNIDSKSQSGARTTRSNRSGASDNEVCFMTRRGWMTSMTGIRLLCSEYIC